jgi:hypothetical protein
VTGADDVGGAATGTDDDDDDDDGDDGDRDDETDVRAVMGADDVGGAAAGTDDDGDDDDGDDDGDVTDGRGGDAGDAGGTAPRDGAGAARRVGSVARDPGTVAAAGPRVAGGPVTGPERSSWGAGFCAATRGRAALAAAWTPSGSLDFFAGGRPGSAPSITAADGAAAPAAWGDRDAIGFCFW